MSRPDPKDRIDRQRIDNRHQTRDEPKAPDWAQAQVAGSDGAGQQQDGLKDEKRRKHRRNRIDRRKEDQVIADAVDRPKDCQARKPQPHQRMALRDKCEGHDKP